MTDSRIIIIVVGASANASPHTQKLRRGVTHIWGNPRGQLHRSAMEKPRSRGTALVITVSPRPGKYEVPEQSLTNLGSNFSHKDPVTARIMWELE